MRKYLFIFILVWLGSIDSRAKVVLPSFFGDGMVLQHDTLCNLWGRADAQSVVSVVTSWDNKTYTTRAGADGHWRLAVATPHAGGPYAILFTDKTLPSTTSNKQYAGGSKGSNSRGKGASRKAQGKQPSSSSIAWTQLESSRLPEGAVRVSNVLIGEVWICAGQSNMEMPMKGFKGQPVEGATEELLSGTDSQLHLFTVARHASLTPIDTVKGSWSEATPAAVRQFSATAYFFGKTLRHSLGVPVGLIVTSWGGSACEAWMTGEWLQPFSRVKLPNGQADVDKRQQRCPTALYNGMLHPLIGYTMRGAIWYQGEDNVERWQYYADLMATMVKGWRQEWKEGDFPFYYCQIAPYDYSLIDWHYNSAFLREQQAMVERKVPNCRMAVLMDAGLEYGIHPRKKRLAGERLALLALSNTYKVAGLPEFACFKDVVFRGDTAVISFDRSKEWVYFNHGTTSRLFRIAGSDRVFHDAQVWTSSNKVYVRSDSVPHPVAVRYAFRDWAEGDLFHDGLPVSSFRTDTWDDVLDNNQ
jgi:sialate O-acetylesterase